MKIIIPDSQLSNHSSSFKLYLTKGCCLLSKSYEKLSQICWARYGKKKVRFNCEKLLARDFIWDILRCDIQRTAQKRGYLKCSRVCKMKIIAVCGLFLPWVSFGLQLVWFLSLWVPQMLLFPYNPQNSTKLQALVFVSSST